jgi:hypothetical protein
LNLSKDDERIMGDESLTGCCLFDAGLDNKIYNCI